MTSWRPIMFRLLKSTSVKNSSSLLSSQLYSDETFYNTFLRDISGARRLIIIESPFITKRRFTALFPAIQKAQQRGIKIVINTRDPAEHDEMMSHQAGEVVSILQNIGIKVIYTNGLHRKLAMIDDDLLWEGSLNILSQSDSCEIMHRIQSPDMVKRMVKFTNLGKWYN